MVRTLAIPNCKIGLGISYLQYNDQYVMYEEWSVKYNTKTTWYNWMKFGMDIKLKTGLKISSL